MKIRLRVVLLYVLPTNQAANILATQTAKLASVRFIYQNSNWIGQTDLYIDWERCLTSKQSIHNTYILAWLFDLQSFFVPILHYLATFHLRSMRFTFLNPNLCYYHQITQLIFPFLYHFLLPLNLFTLQLLPYPPITIFFKNSVNGPIIRTLAKMSACHLFFWLGMPAITSNVDILYRGWSPFTCAHCTSNIKRFLWL